MPAAIRRLGAGDVEKMRALNAVFGRAFSDPDTYGAAPPDAAYLACWLGQAHALALVAVVSGLVANELQTFEQARSEVYRYDLMEAEEYRRRGSVLHRLMNVEIARGLGNTTYGFTFTPERSASETASRPVSRRERP